jgi:hypothetical protein
MEAIVQESEVEKLLPIFDIPKKYGIAVWK